MKLNIPLPMFDQATRDFHHKYCGNHKYMIDAMMLHPEVWEDCAVVAQIAWLEAMEEKPNKYVMKRLIQRYHALARKQDIAIFWEEV